MANIASDIFEEENKTNAKMEYHQEKLLDVTEDLLEIFVYLSFTGIKILMMKTG